MNASPLAGLTPFGLAAALVAGVFFRRVWDQAGWSFSRPWLSLAVVGAGGVAVRSFGSRTEPWGPALLAALAAFMIYGVVERGRIRHGAAWVGHSAIVRGRALRQGRIGSALLTDGGGQVLVEPLHEGDRFASGTRVLLVHPKQGRFLVVEDDSGLAG